MKFQKWVLTYYAVLFTLFGITGFLFPEQTSQLIHYEFKNNIAKMEFSSTYGGLFIGIGLFMFYCLKTNIHTGLICVLVTMGTMFITRTFAYLTYNEIDLIQYIYLSGELFTLFLIAYLIAFKPLRFNRAV